MAAKGLISTRSTAGLRRRPTGEGGRRRPLACLPVVFLYLGAWDLLVCMPEPGWLRLEAPIRGRGFLWVGAPMPGAADVVTASPACPAVEAAVEIVGVLASGLGL